MKSIALILLFISQLSFASEAPLCKTTNLGLAKMLPVANQGSRKDCYIFSGVALIENFYCKDKTPACSDTDLKSDRLSRLDANALTNHRQILNDGGSTIEVLKAIRNAGGLFKDSCAPYDIFLKNSGWATNIQNAVRLYQTPGMSTQNCRGVASELKNKLGLVTDLEPIMNALSKKNLGITIYDLVIPKACEDQRVKLKNFETHILKDDHPEKIRETIIAQLSRNIPLSTDICAFPPSQKDCGPHALVVSGVRKTCCAGACKYEYQFYDSSQAFSSKEMTADQWVPESVYFERLARIRKAETARPDLRTDLIWIE